MISITVSKIVASTSSTLLQSDSVQFGIGIINRFIWKQPYRAKGIVTYAKTSSLEDKKLINCLDSTTSNANVVEGTLLWQHSCTAISYEMSAYLHPCTVQ